MQERLWSLPGAGTSGIDRTEGEMTEHHRNKWLILAVVGAAFFMTILDVAIVNVAIPSIQEDLNIAESTVNPTPEAGLVGVTHSLLSELLGKMLFWT